MNILAVGDVVGDTGTEMFVSSIDALKEEYKIDFCIVNGENACSNNGITRKKAEMLLAAGADAITLGNHTFRQKEAFSLVQNNERIVRPLNYPPQTAGEGIRIFEVKNKKIAVINLLGRIYMGESTDCPFRAADAVLDGLSADIIIVDFHAEATSEKVSMGWYLDGRVSVVFGTHTHVQTADAWVLTKGTGYITDLGMTGPYFSCLGVERQIILDRFIKCIPQRFEFTDGAAQLSGAVFCIDEQTGRALSVQPVFLR